MLKNLLSIFFAFSTVFVSWNSVAEGAVAADPGQGKSINEGRIDMLVDSIHQEMRNKHFERANLMVLAAKQGNTKACNIVGWMFDNGIAVKKDSAKALKWFLSCARRNPLAAYNVGVLYAEGRGVNKDMDKAVATFKMALSLGGIGFRGQIPQIPIRIAYYYRKKKSNADAWDWAEKASILNAKHGKYLVARMLVEQTAPYSDDAKARNYLNAAVEEYSAAAASLLSWSYGTGRLTDKNIAMAYEYEQLASRIDPKSQAYSTMRWGSGLSDEARHKAEASAMNWVATHKTPMQIDFTSTLDGTEAQFSK